ncbi:MAG: hypothetical protein Kow001_20720 [Acidobacteriota bacterium]
MSLGHPRFLSGRISPCGDPARLFDPPNSPGEACKALQRVLEIPGFCQKPFKSPLL